MSRRVIQANPVVISKEARALMVTGASIYIWYRLGALEALVERMKKRMTVMMTKAIPLVTKEPRLKKQPLRRQ